MMAPRTKQLLALKSRLFSRDCWRRALFGAAASAAVLATLLAVRVAFEPFPEALREAAPDASLRVYDRSGHVLRELRAADGRRRARVRLGDVAPDLITTLLAIEDRRFFLHPGVDPIAVLRATGQALAARRIVSGASTLSQQLARTLISRPRTLRGKFQEAVVALRIEASLDKTRILEEYLSRVEFGPNLVGVEAASRHYFDKPARSLDLAESAALVALVRGPSLYDPRRGTERLRRRRDSILERLAASGALSPERVRLARESEVTLQPGGMLSGTEHLAFALASGKLVPELASQKLAAIHTTLDADLQREVEVLSRRAARELAAVGGSALAVLVVDNRSAEVRAYVGSPDYFATGALGGNDGTRALRQPGSALKPFVYAAGMERLGWTPATVFSDRSLELDSPDGRYSPANYDGREHGPVRLRLALANSLNLPAVRAAAQVGPGHALEMLRRFGFTSLDRNAEFYGPAIALGSGEVRLSELVQAYSALARDGRLRPLVYARRAELATGGMLELPAAAPRRVLDPRIARELTSVLADDAARSESFGARGALAFPFPAAAKTGTSKGFRDNWAVAYTREFSVAVWSGNFDGRPLVRSSGVSGAGPLLHAVMLAAMRGVSPAPLLSSEGLVPVEVCALSGALPGPGCRDHVLEHVVPERAPRARCDAHEMISIDPTNGLRAGPGCRNAELRAFERYSELDSPWAVAAGRPLAPAPYSARCPLAPGSASRSLRIAWPENGSRFVLDPERTSEDIVVEVTSSRDAGEVRLLLDEREVARGGTPLRARVVLAAGEHTLRSVSSGVESEPVRIRVDPG